MSSRCLQLTIAALLLVCPQAAGQRLASVHVVVVASDGSGETLFRGGESAGADLEQALISWFPGSAKTRILLRTSGMPVEDLMLSLAATVSGCDSGDVLLLFWLGPWDRRDGNPLETRWLAPGAATITAEYLLNVVSLVAPQSVAAYIVAPPGQSFPAASLEHYPSAQASGGKHIFLITGSASADYDDLISGVVDAAESLAAPEVLDANTNGDVSYAEWLMGFYRSARAEGLALKGFTLNRAPSPSIRRVTP